MDTVSEAQSLYQRFEKSEAFQGYVKERLRLVIPALAVFLFVSLAAAAGTVMLVGGTRSILVLLGLIAAPFLLIGSMFVQSFVFFWWLEWRAIDRLSGRAPKPPAGMPRTRAEVRALLGRPPEVPWIPAAVFLLLPFLALAALDLKWALMLLLLLAATPVAYSLLDR